MPGAGGEGAVKVWDEAGLCEVEFDLSVQFRPHQLPQFPRRQADSGGSLGGHGLAGCFPLRREDVLGVEPAFVRFP